MSQLFLRATLIVISLVAICHLGWYGYTRHMLVKNSVAKVTLESIPMEPKPAEVEVPCKEEEAVVAKKNLLLVAAIASAPGNFDKRAAIRETWFQAKEIQLGVVKPLFFVGITKDQAMNDRLSMEAEENGDMVILDLIEGYYMELVTKTAIMIEWCYDHFFFDFLMKVDDDTFVEFKKLMKVLEWLPKKASLYGYILTKVGPRRDPADKWYLSPEEFPEPAFPAYPNGPCYVLTQDLCGMLSKEKKRGKLYFPVKFEDVSLGYWVRHWNVTEGIDLQLVNDMNMATEFCTEDTVSLHHAFPDRMRCLWRKSQQYYKNWCC